MVVKPTEPGLVSEHPKETERNSNRFPDPPHGRCLVPRKTERDPNSPWYNLPDAATYAAGASSDTIGDALRSGELRGYQAAAGGKWRIHRDDLDAWIRGEIAPVEVPKITRRKAS
jgi:excisionase family DNA binding protein